MIRPWARRGRPRGRPRAGRARRPGRPGGRPRAAPVVEPERGRDAVEPAGEGHDHLRRAARSEALQHQRARLERSAGDGGPDDGLERRSADPRGAAPAAGRRRLHRRLANRVRGGRPPRDRLVRLRPRNHAGGVGAVRTAGAVETSSAGPSPAAIAGRWLLYLGLLALLGLGFFGAVDRALATADRSAPAGGRLGRGRRRHRRGDRGSGHRGGRRSRAGLGDLVRSADRRAGRPLLIAGLALIVGARSVGGIPLVLTIVALAAAGALLADVLASHAAAGTQPRARRRDPVRPRRRRRALDRVVSRACSSPSAVGCRTSRPRRTAKRFSWVATVGIATVAVTGLLRAISEVGTIDALFSTDFGRLLIAKTALLAVLAVLGAVNHFRNVPAAGRVLTGYGGSARSRSSPAQRSCCWPRPSSTSRRRPRRSGRGATPSPSPTPAPLVVSGTDFGTSVRLSLEISPGLTGFNTFRATVTDYDSGAPVAAEWRHAALLDPRPDRCRELAARPARPPPPGVFSATGGNLSLDGSGRSRRRSRAERPRSRCRWRSSRRRRANRSTSTGWPAFRRSTRSISRPAARSRSISIPTSRAQNDFHVTFFDAAGAELPATTSASPSRPAAAAPQQLTVRTLEPGHVVATLSVDDAPHAVRDRRRPRPGGDQLQAQLVITPGS